MSSSRSIFKYPGAFFCTYSTVAPSIIENIHPWTIAQTFNTHCPLSSRISNYKYKSWKYKCLIRHVGVYLRLTDYVNILKSYSVAQNYSTHLAYNILYHYDIARLSSWLVCTLLHSLALGTRRHVLKLYTIYIF